MKNIGLFKDKRILVVGLARSGFACARLLADLGARVSVTDNQENRTTLANAEALAEQGIQSQLGLHTRTFCCDKNLVVVSPGVPDTALPVVWAREEQTPVVSEIEAGWLVCPCPVIAVTGSSGKTTVTTLIGMALAEAGRRAIVCGNIGTPFTQEVTKAGETDVIALEVSSFQLEHIETFRPHIAVITNISRNHLDRYAGMNEYIAAKKRIFLNQDASDFAVLNGSDAELERLAGALRPAIRYFGTDKDFNPNQSCVAAVCEIMGITRECCLRAFSKFKGLEHRMEEVVEVAGVRFINDSKATTAESCLWALESIKAPVVLICGGRDKGVDYTRILDAARYKVKEAVLIGEARQKIALAFAGTIPVSECETLSEAVEAAFGKASAGDFVLLSPMCSSFDMFQDYEERGRAFKDAVKRLAAAHKVKP
ncbi:MAG: UDP-N-acetylmuramoyl-L-alanine--D-glutamate ligase [Candidatus Omnitrophica bacterium]|nr:UDP-N-acetylmuramoyl-L-alanine--D-glutamate ligase [Candidatus Omnitrophota bacterium]